jgi:predicted protein tyrosine phosphatase
MKVESINRQKARELKEIKRLHPEMANSFYLSNDLFYAIVGKEEFKEMSLKLNNEDKKNMVVISITEPDNSYIEDIYINGFHDVLETKFWDIETDIIYEEGKSYYKITKEEGLKIKEFILKNKDKKFFIHCAAGVSRSAGVSCACEALILFQGNVYEYQTGYSEVKSHPRYAPNYSVFDAICKE